jgi:hypothetical protein
MTGCTISYEEHRANWVGQIGLEDTRDLFAPCDVESSFEVDRGVIVSSGRLVTLHHESFSLIAFGARSGVYIKVWENRALVEVCFINVEHILQAASGDFETPIPWPEGKYAFAKWQDDFVELGEFRRRPGAGERCEVASVHLTRDELSYLCDRLAIFADYEPLEEPGG